MSRMAAVIVAADAETRFGRPFPLVYWRGRPFVQHLIRVAHAVHCEPVVVVQGAWPLRGGAVKGAQLVDHPEWEKGMLSCIQAGLKPVLRASSSGVIVLTCRQPHVQINTLDAVIEAARIHPDAVIRPGYGDCVGAPVLLPPVVAKQVLEREKASWDAVLQMLESVTRVIVTEDRAVLEMVDTIEEIRALRKRFAD